jgi:hypothetical protein
MSQSHWYSAKLKFVAIVGPDGGDLVSESVYLLQAGDFGDALNRALMIGKKAERTYKNDQGKLVSWTLMEVITLDIIQAPDLDGAEVYCDLARHSYKIPVGTRFAPEESKPRQTI